MQAPQKFRSLLITGVLLELLIVLNCHISFNTIGEVFRHAARYSGRLSLVIYLIAFLNYTKSFRTQLPIDLRSTRTLVAVFAVLHYIHLGFLTMNVRVNAIQLVPIKLLGGALAYLMILIYPFVIQKLKARSAVHLVYFYYVGLVMAITYVARFRGDFEGAAPSPIHYVGLITVILTLSFGGYCMLRDRRVDQS